MKRNKNWAPVAVSDEIDPGWNFEPAKPYNKRIHARIKEKEISALFDVEGINVTFTTHNSIFPLPTLLDISAGGIAVSSLTGLSADLPIEVEFFLGKKKIIASANVRRILQRGVQYIMGIMFVDFAKDSAAYIDGSITINALINKLEIDTGPDLVLNGEDRNVGFSHPQGHHGI